MSTARARLLASCGICLWAACTDPTADFDPVDHSGETGTPVVDTCDIPGTICRLAGSDSGVLGFNDEGLPAIDSWLYYPSALAWMPDGRLLIDDFNNMRLRVIEDDGTLTTLVGDGTHAYAVPFAAALDSPMENPVDISVGPDGSLYISELHAARILRVGEEQVIEVVAGTGKEGFTGDGGPATEALMSQSAGVAVSEDGTIYISDTENHCIRRVDPEGVMSTLAGNGEPGPAEDSVAFEAARFDNPQRIRLVDGGLLVADTANHVIRRLDFQSGVVDILVGNGTEGFSGDGGSARDAQLNEPYGMTQGEDGVLYVADSANNRIRRVGLDGVIDSIAGTGGEQLSGDEGPAVDAAVFFPTDVLLGGDAALYIADMRNGAVRRIAGPIP